MECYTYCTATSYDAKKVLHLLQQIPSAQQIQPERDHISFLYGGGTVFLFMYAVVTFWDVPDPLRVELITLLKEAMSQPLPDWEIDQFKYFYGNETKIAQDHFIIAENARHHMLGISHALAQSSKLSFFEKLIQDKINDTKHLPIELSTKGTIPLSRRALAKKRGELFIARNSVNLHTDILDTPEFFWDHSEIEPVYRITASYLELTARVEVLNKRLDIVHELFQMLGDQLESEHAALLEWVIIILIAIEILLSIFTHFVH
jgi:uncharacterized Rmd1/YagE family protein